MPKWVVRLITVLLIFCAGYFAAVAFSWSRAGSPPVVEREQDSERPFIRPIIGVTTDKKEYFEEYEGVQSAVEDFIAEKKAAGDVIRASVYFRNLRNSHWFGVEEDAPFASASLLKVPLMMAYFKYMEETPNDLSKPMTFSKAAHAGSSTDVLMDPSSLQDGKVYTAREVIEAMITRSDNGAMYLLQQNIPERFQAEVFTEEGIELPINNSYSISAAEYGKFFRRLFNSTLLSRDHSNAALEILSRSVYSAGLAAGLPEGTQVAHKYGRYASVFHDGSVAEIELHDCGIVYLQSSEYLLCVMTQGKDEAVLGNVIAGITKIVYRQSMR